MNSRLLLAVAIAVVLARAQAPEDEDRKTILEEARRTAINYTKHLPDFLCTEEIHRFEADGPSGRFRSSDILTLQLSYFQLHENYKLVARNNRPTKQSLQSVGGALNSGEFGSTLLLIFHPVSKAVFAFQEWSELRGRRVAVYSYRVERANSHFELRMVTNSVMAGYHGEIFVDAATHTVLRIAEEIDVPERFPVQYSRNTVDYDFVDVGGHQYLLPLACESESADLPPSRGRNGQMLPLSAQMAQQKRYKNLTDFHEYRKYAAESSVSFDAPDGPPKK